MPVRKTTREVVVTVPGGPWYPRGLQSLKVCLQSGRRREKKVVTVDIRVRTHHHFDG